MPIGGHVFNGSEYLNNIGKARVIQETFVPNYFQIGPVLLDKKIFLRFYHLYIYKEYKLRPLVVMFKQIEII